MAGNDRPRRTHAATAAQVAVVLGILVLNLLQQPGLLTFDTKLDLLFDPTGFMRRSLDLWNPQAAVGELQNQATGYLFPLGPFFALGSALGAPMWLWQRLWTAVLMLLAYDGARRLAARWSGAGPAAATVAGLAYALSPRVLTTVGGLSGETLPTAVLPWTVLPLVLYLAGRLRRGTALLVSASTVVAMGGQNATEVLACLVLPVLVIIGSGQPWRRRLGDLVGWGAGVAAVTLWWSLPLLLLGSYGPPFLDFIESARNTTSSIGSLAALRGADHWIAYLPDGASSGWQGGWLLVSSPWLVAVTSVVAAVGLAGLTWLPFRPRRVLMASTALGLLVLTLGAAGWDASPVRDTWLVLLDGVLAPFRNIHKFDPLVRLPLSMGVGAATGVALTAARRRAAAGWAGGTGRVGAGLIALAVLLGAAPLFTGELRPEGGFRDIPASWRAAATYLDRQPGPTRVLVLPASGFGIQTWGRTIDTPLQVLTDTPWVMRNQTPLVPPQTTQLLDGVEQLVTAGRSADGVVTTLRRLGITAVLLRHDLDPAETDAPPATAVRAALTDAGLRLARTFGAPGGAAPVDLFLPPARASEPRVRLLPYGERLTVSGGSASLVPLVRAGLLPEDRLMLPELRPGRPADVVTDGERRVERNFGRVHEAVSDVMTPGEPYRDRRARHDYTTGRQLTVARYSGILDVRASTSTGYADTPGPVRPAEAPWAAVDGSFLTSWSSAPLSPPVGQWLELRFRRPTWLQPLGLDFDVTNGAAVRGVRLATGRGSFAVSLGSDGVVRGLPVPARLLPSKHLRLIVTAVAGEPRPVRLTELSLGGLAPSRALDVPGVVGPATRVLLTSDPGRPACLAAEAGYPVCSSDRPSVSTEQAGFTRLLHVVDGARRVALSGRVVATNGAQLAALFEPLSARPVTVRASSFLAGDPAVVPQNAFDGDPATTWVASAADRHPVLDLRWRTPRLVTRIRPTLQPGSTGRQPTILRVTSDAGSQTVRVGPESLAVLDPVRTRHLRVALDGDPLAGDAPAAPFAVSELGVEGLERLTYHASPTARTGAACGLGPTVVVAGTALPTRVVGTLGDVLSGVGLRLEPCGPRPLLPPGAQVPVSVRNAPGFGVTSLLQTPSGAAGVLPAGPTPAPPEAHVRAWGPTARIVRVTTATPAVLTVPQSSNPGWTATLAGRPLRPVDADGWMQGWLVPAGVSGTVRLHLEPQPLFVGGVVGGLLVAAALVAAAGWALAARRTRVPAGRGAAVRSAGRSAVRSAGRPGEVARARSTTALAVLALPASAVLSWPLTLGLVLGVLAVRARRAAVGATAGLLVAVAGLWAAASVDRSVVAPSAADVLAAVAVGLVVGREAAGPARRGGRGTVGRP